MTDWRTALAALPEQARVVIRYHSGQLLADVLAAAFDRRLVCVPLSPRTPDGDLADAVRRVSASLVLDGPDTVRAMQDGPGEAPVPDLAFVMFTSGSTGRPKGVMLGRAAVLGNAGKVAELHGFGPDRPHGTCLPLYHVNALMMSLLGTRLARAPLVLCERFEPGEYLRRLGAAGARTAAIVPAHLHALVEESPAWPDSLDYLITAAAPLTSELAGRFHRGYGPRLRQGYGLSEAVNFSFVMPLLDDRDFREQYVANPPPVGLPLPGTDVRLVDGEVWLRTPDVMAGYWGDPDATAAVLGEDGWLRTGDLGELRDGFLVLRGRRTEVVNRGGEKYFPLDVERQWRAAGLAGTFAAVPVPHPTLGQDIGLVTESDQAGRVRALFAASVPRPAAVVTAPLLATSTGKPRRLAMGERLVPGHDSAARYEDLLRYARGIARSIVDSEHRPACARATRIAAHAAALLAAARSATTTAPGGAAWTEERRERSDQSDEGRPHRGSPGPARAEASADITAPGGAAWTEERRERSDQSDEGRQHRKGPGPAPAEAGARITAAHDTLDAIVAGWADLASGAADGGAIVRRHPGLWRRLMVEWPMGAYAELMAATLRAAGALDGRVLEVGSGVGNTTALVGPAVTGTFVWSDREPELVRRGAWPGTGRIFDFDRDPPDDLAGFDAILATNAVHCAADKLGTLVRLRAMLAGGGRLFLAEGSPVTRPGLPWALDFLFCAFDGWWDRGGFLTRWEWLSLLDGAGFTEPGFTVLRAGGHDLGGVVWAKARGDRRSGTRS